MTKKMTREKTGNPPAFDKKLGENCARASRVAHVSGRASWVRVSSVARVQGVCVDESSASWGFSRLTRGWTSREVVSCSREIVDDRMLFVNLRVEKKQEGLGSGVETNFASSDGGDHG